MDEQTQPEPPATVRCRGCDAPLADTTRWLCERCTRSLWLAMHGACLGFDPASKPPTTRDEGRAFVTRAQEAIVAARMALALVERAGGEMVQRTLSAGQLDLHEDMVRGGRTEDARRTLDNAIARYRQNLIAYASQFGGDVT